MIRIARSSSFWLISAYLVFAVGCATPPQKLAAPDEPYAVYPRYRIDPLPRRVCVVATGEGQDDIVAAFTKGLISMEPPIKVIEPGNLEAVLKGKILEYATGLTKQETQAISQMSQVDHIFFLHETIAPFESYRYGGRFFDRIHLKIFSTADGEIVFQTTQEHGINYPDLRNRGGLINRDVNLVKWAREWCMRKIAFELCYALGYSDAGVVFMGKPLQIGGVLVHSPAYKAGIKEGDKIIAINGIPVASPQDLQETIKEFGLLYQGVAHVVSIERDGAILQFTMESPTIPKPPTEEVPEKKQNIKADDRTV